MGRYGSDRVGADGLGSAERAEASPLACAWLTVRVASLALVSGRTAVTVGRPGTQIISNGANVREAGIGEVGDGPRLVARGMYPPGVRIFEPGEVIDRREVLHGLPWLAVPVRVVHDSGDVLVTYLAEGTSLVFAEHPFGPHPWRGGRGASTRSTTGSTFDPRRWAVEGPRPCGRTRPDRTVDQRRGPGRVGRGGKVAAALDRRDRWFDPWVGWVCDPAWAVSDATETLARLSGIAPKAFD
jgi:hypothetical protein